MKKSCLCLPVILIALFSFPLLINAEDGVGAYVNSNKGTPIPNGHYGLIAKYADQFLSGIAHRTIYAATLVDGVDLPDVADELSDFFLLDIRRPADYCAGHIKGAVNILFEEVAKPENLIKLPSDKPILIICYTGHTASQINAILNMLGYDAWTLRFGMTSWRNVSPTRVWSSRQTPQNIYGGNYPIETCQ
ncbi:MAG: rhodanese-like domain-containing protein [Thermodesulfovibrionales bacterium]|nr:rhodanese-like domain-containing protein [Thermodesulfovibrionales bacterium]